VDDQSHPELSGIVNVMPVPPMAMVPPGAPQPAGGHGHAGLGGPGGARPGRRRAVRALAAPLADLVQPMPYPGIYPPDDEAFHPTAIGHTMFVDTVDQQAAETILEYLRSSDAPVRVAQLRVLGGAMARVPAEATAFAHRGSKIMVNVASFYPWGSSATRAKAASTRPTWQRLAAVKAPLRPNNLFRGNHNIPPAADRLGSEGAWRRTGGNQPIVKIAEADVADKLDRLDRYHRPIRLDRQLAAARPTLMIATRRRRFP
jgi:hypothetical protein